MATIEAQIFMFLVFKNGEDFFSALQILEMHMAAWKGLRFCSEKDTHSSPGPSLSSLVTLWKPFIQPETLVSSKKGGFYNFALKVRKYQTLSKVLYNRCSKWYSVVVVIVLIVLEISQNVENTEKFSSSQVTLEKVLKWVVFTFFKIECYYKRDIVSGTRKSVVDKAEIVLSWSLREGKHISGMINIFVRGGATSVVFLFFLSLLFIIVAETEAALNTYFKWINKKRNKSILGLLQSLTFTLLICICWEPNNHCARPRTFRIIDIEWFLKNSPPIISRMEVGGCQGKSNSSTVACIQ